MPFDLGTAALFGHFGAQGRRFCKWPEGQSPDPTAFVRVLRSFLPGIASPQPLTGILPYISRYFDEVTVLSWLLRYITHCLPSFDMGNLYVI